MLVMFKVSMRYVKEVWGLLVKKRIIKKRRNKKRKRKNHRRRKVKIKNNINFLVELIVLKRI